MNKKYLKHHRCLLLVLEKMIQIVACKILTGSVHLAFVRGTQLRLCGSFTIQNVPEVQSDFKIRLVRMSYNHLRQKWHY